MLCRLVHKYSFVIVELRWAETVHVLIGKSSLVYWLIIRYQHKPYVADKYLCIPSDMQALSSV